MTSLGERLRLRAGELELTDAEVARRVGISARRNNHYVTGRNEPNLDTLIKICRALNTTPNQLLGFEALKDADGMERTSLYDRITAAANVLEIDRLRLVTNKSKLRSKTDPRRNCSVICSIGSIRINVKTITI
ncbi:MAG: helix-turn-helix transcriptional regulator [Rhodobacteraceae bacterium]|nr:helix-turn-helix transcriptional regulator [Paracoccaceae bacterium]